MEPRPIILLDREYWTGIIDWMKQIPNQRGLMSLKDFDCLHIVDTPEDAFELVSKAHRTFIHKKPHAAAK
jgi:predicted Rossmann-fold nucleotide-binding protein